MGGNASSPVAAHREPDHQAWHEALRRSAAFSTWDMGDTSQGPDPRVAAEVISSPQGALLKASHETARRHQHCRHQRSLFLSASGCDLRGEEMVQAPHGTAGETSALPPAPRGAG